MKKELSTLDSNQSTASSQYSILRNVKIADNYLSLPKIGDVSAIIHRPVEGKVKTVTISKNCSNQYFAAILFDDGKDLPSSTTEGKAVGIDLGLTHFAITSSLSRTN
ncbi:hypothetical protein [Nostoc commune]|uniref:hypothetical protein n=1 Tax=Nostoc commune TaxID=1178 RepID=UPI0020749B50|nr:hypothetical protein [Nostoc commune]